MIGFVGLRPPSQDPGTVVQLAELPGIPAANYSGILVRCDSDDKVHDALRWCSAVRKCRPNFAFGLVCKADDCVRALGEFPERVTPVLSPMELEGDRVPTDVLAGIRRESIEGRIMDELILEADGHILEEPQLLRVLVAHGVRGHRLGRVANSMKLSIETVRRRLKRAGFSAGRLLTRVRLRAYDLSLEQGGSPSVALEACGWFDQEARRKCVRRLRREQFATNS